MWPAVLKFNFLVSLRSKFNSKVYRVACVFSLIFFSASAFSQTPSYCGGYFCPGECEKQFQQFIDTYSKNPNEICYGGRCAIYSVTLSSNYYYAGATYLANYYYIGQDGSTYEISHCYGISSPQPTPIPPVTSQNSCHVPAHSSINMDSLSLDESIPIVGVPFFLSYSSDRFRSGTGFNPVSIGLGGWTPSLLHHYDSKNALVYYGNGAIRNTQAAVTSDGYYTTDQAGKEVYCFNSSGMHTSTKDALTGLTKYTFNYDAAGKLVLISDQFNNKISFQYSNGQVFIVSPYDQKSIVKFDSNGFLGSVTNPNGEVYSVSNSNAGFLQSFTKPAGQTSTVTYSEGLAVSSDQGAGGDLIRLSQSIDPLSGVQTVTSTTALGRMVSYKTGATKTSSNHTVISSDGSIANSSNIDQGTNSSADAYGNINSGIQVQDPRFGWLAPYEASSSYKVLNSNINITAQVSKTVQLLRSDDPLSLSSLSMKTTLQNDASRTFTTDYDSTKGLLTSLSPLKRVVNQTLNTNGQTASIQVGSLSPVNFTYDNHGRLSTMEQSDRKLSLTYDVHGNVATSTDFAGRRSAFLYDNANRVTQQTLPDGNVVAMAYDANGNMISITPPGRAAHNFSYNLFELLSEYLPPAISAGISGATTYSYNLDKQPTQINKPDGSQVVISYDSASGLLNQVTTPGGNYSYNYLEKSNLVSSLSSPDSITLSYQYAGNIPTLTATSGSISSSLEYSYNEDGSVAAISVTGKSGSSSSVSISYDKDGLIVGVGSEGLTRNNVGAVSATQLGKISEVESFDKFGQKLSSKFTEGKRTIFSEEFLRDKLGRVVEVKESPDRERGDRSYKYDEQGRLTTVSFGKWPLSIYKYDQNGNRIEAWTDRGLVKAEYDVQDRLIKYGKTSYQYNANGDLMQKIEGDKNSILSWLHVSNAKDKQKITKYSYDVFGNLKSVVLPNKELIEYIIDGQNRRVGKKINGKLVQGFVYQSQTQIAAELDGNGNLVKRFVYGSKGNIPDYMIYEGKQYRIISDQVGTPKMIVDSSNGRVVERFNYDEFGLSRGRKVRAIIPFGFAGGLYDNQTNLVRFGARDYDPETGRWTSKDPIRFGGGDTNLFGYVSNDPNNFIDPKGLWSFSVSGYGILGGGITIGQNPNGNWFGSIRGGVGVGGGVSFDKNGTSPSGNMCSAGGVSTGQFAEGGAHFGPFETGFNSNSGYSQRSGAYANPIQLVPSVTPSIGVGIGVSGGFEITFE